MRIVTMRAGRVRRVTHHVAHIQAEIVARERRLAGGLSRTIRWNDGRRGGCMIAPHGVNPDPAV